MYKFPEGLYSDVRIEKVRATLVQCLKGDLRQDGAAPSARGLRRALCARGNADRLPELQLTASVYEMYGKDFLGVSSDKIMPLANNRWLGFLLNVRKM